MLVEAAAGPADPADPPGRDPDDEGEVGHVLDDRRRRRATIAQRPIVTGATHTARAPMEAPSPMVHADRLPVVGRLERPVGVDRARVVSLVSTTAGPMKTPSPSTAGS